MVDHIAVEMKQITRVVILRMGSVIDPDECINHVALNLSVKHGFDVDNAFSGGPTRYVHVDIMLLQLTEHYVLLSQYNMYLL